ncbi:cathepsin G-like [Xiphias gladius]|uniref:cathepsin G-like n=1 Tax=Xiphias gladius TaxID=8245 RepID=UPI001A99E828|nr:cathepsin G-like [Xiphias gladius]
MPRLSRKDRPRRKVSIKPIQLPQHQIKLRENTKCRVAGWGFTKTGGTVVDDLQVVDVSIINLGDSGGPLVCGQNMAFGVVSFNNNRNCDYPNVPNIFTDISKFLPWIKDILKKKQC